MKVGLSLLMLLLTATAMVNGTGSDDSDSEDSEDSKDSSPDHQCRPYRYSAPSYHPHPKTCEDGPAKVLHKVPYEIHFPKIFKGSCDNLKCDYPPCVATKKVWKKRCVFVYKIIHGRRVKLGYRIRRFLDHQECKCRTVIKSCSDIKNARQCVNTKPCPESKNRNSFCFYKPGQCACCTPYDCPRGQFFNKKTCSCDCPRGSKKVGDRCVGDCSDISTRYCKSVYCEDNPTEFCFIGRNRKCQCPEISCDDQKNPSLCPKTRCLEQPRKPYCVYDRYSRKCRCPECKDQDTKRECINFYCGRRRCKYNDYSNKCFCPKH